MRTPFAAYALLLTATALLAAPTGAHPPATDTSQGCLDADAEPGAGAFHGIVDGTLSYLAPPPLFLAPLCLTILPLTVPPLADAWGSHAAACPAFPTIIAGAWCGALVPAGGSDVCTWAPDINSFQTKLVVGFDVNLDGRITHPAESPLIGPLAPGSWKVANPHAVAARLIAYPTNVDPLFPGATTIADANFLEC